MQKNIMLISGEASGDIYAKNLIREIKQISGNKVNFYGMGGKVLKELGMEILFPAEKISIMGFTEVVPKFFLILKALSVLKKALRERRPDLLILIDFPDFNFFLGRYAKKIGIKILYYVSPQIWAWRKGRIKTIKNMVTHMAVILPFEEEFYKKHNVPVTYVGHPILDETEGTPLKKYEKEKIALLPGSRNSEVTSLIDVMLQSTKIIRQKDESVTFILLVAPLIKTSFIEDKLKEYNLQNVVEISRDKVKVFEESSFVILASGTATIEAAINNKPMLIIYKVSSLSYFIGKCFVKIKNIGLVNIIAGKEVFRELLQDNASPQNIADEVMKIIYDENKKSKLYFELNEINKKLGEKGASRNTAKLACKIIDYYYPN